MWITFLGGFYGIHVIYTYIIPYYWILTPLKNDEYTYLRMKDALASTVWEELGGTDFSEWGWQPHDFVY